MTTTLPIRLYFSPCPNDTFIFAPIVLGLIDTEGLSFEVTLGDVESMNRRAMEGSPDMVKVSYHAWYYVQAFYHLLDAGSALGRGVGPLLVARELIPEKELEHASIAIPGEYTTAHLLFRLVYPEARKKQFMVFHEIENAVLNGFTDAGVIIHENRFTYESRGLVKIRDLGEWWETETGLPIPLGGIVAHRRLGPETISRLNKIMHQSVMYAMARPEEVMPYVSKHAREMDEAVMKKHIALYVNNFTTGLDPTGKDAVEALKRRLGG